MESGATPTAKRYFAQPRGQPTLWVGLLLPPFAWFLDLQLRYMLAPRTCVTERQFALHLVTLAMLLLAASGGLVAWHTWQRVGHDSPDEPGGIVPRRRFAVVRGL